MPKSATVSEEDCYEVIAPIPLVRSFELIGLGIRTQIEYFIPKVSQVSVRAERIRIAPDSPIYPLVPAKQLLKHKHGTNQL